MKKALSILVLLLFLLSFPVCAASGRLSANDVQGKVGGQVTVTVHLDNPGIVATRIFVRYDSAVLRLDSAENGDVFKNNCAVFGKDTSANPYTLLWDDSLRTNNNTSSGTLCTLRFTVLKEADSGSTGVRIAVDKASTFDVDLNEVTIADSTCTVQTGIASTASQTTSAANTTTQIQSASPTTKKQTLTTTQKQTSTTTQKQTAATTQKPSAKIITAAPSASTTRPITSTVKPATTVDPTTASASVSSSVAAVSSTAAQTTAGVKTPNTVPETTAVGNEETVSLSLQAQESEVTSLADAEEILSESDSRTADGDETAEPVARRVNLLWLLVLVPVAAVLVIVLLKKKK